MERLYTLIVILSIMFLPALVPAADDSVPRITKEELKAKMDKGGDVLV